MKTLNDHIMTLREHSEDDLDSMEDEMIAFIKFKQELRASAIEDIKNLPYEDMMSDAVRDYIREKFNLIKEDFK